MGTVLERPDQQQSTRHASQHHSRYGRYIVLSWVFAGLAFLYGSEPVQGQAAGWREHIDPSGIVLSWAGLADPDNGIDGKRLSDYDIGGFIISITNTAKSAIAVTLECTVESQRSHEVEEETFEFGIIPPQTMIRVAHNSRAVVPLQMIRLVAKQPDQDDFQFLFDALYRFHEYEWTIREHKLRGLSQSGADGHRHNVYRRIEAERGRILQTWIKQLGGAELQLANESWSRYVASKDEYAASLEHPDDDTEERYTQFYEGWVGSLGGRPGLTNTAPDEIHYLGSGKRVEVHDREGQEGHQGNLGADDVDAPIATQDVPAPGEQTPSAPLIALVVGVITILALLLWALWDAGKSSLS